MAQTQFSSSTAVTLSANPVVEKCFAKLATEVTEQVRDKLINILIAVLARECEDFDGESVRRLLVTELETTPLTFAVEKRASGTKTLKTPKEKKTKVVELDADGNPVKKVRAPKEPKAAKPVLSEEEREARKAAKKAEKEAEKEAAKAAKKAEKEAAKEARKAAKETEKDADKEAAKAVKLAEKEAEKAAKLAEREAEKAARKAEKDAEREAAKAAKQAEKEAAKAAAPAPAAKEQRLPIPWCGRRIEGRCEALRVYHGLFAQCTSDATEISAFCPSCEKTGAKFGTCAMRAACGLFDYTDPSGKKCTRLANVIHKFGSHAEEMFQVEAAKHDITIPHEHLEKEVKQRGRPKSASPRVSSVATTDSGDETETDDEEHQQKRKQVTKVAASAEAPKKRGRPAKNPKSEVAPSDEVIQDLVASAAAMSIASTPSTPVAAANKPSVETPAAPKKAKAVALKAKPAARKTRVIEEQTFWVDTFNGVEILIRQEDNATFEASNGEPLGFWDDKTKTIIECDEDDEDEE
jgi:hypothetical protein